MKTFLKLLLEILFSFDWCSCIYDIILYRVYLYFDQAHYKMGLLYIKTVYPILRSINLVFDGLANAGAGELLNDSLNIKNDFIRFGKWYETISAVTGLIQQYEKDTGLEILKILGKNHCRSHYRNASLLL